MVHFRQAHFWGHWTLNCESCIVRREFNRMFAVYFVFFSAISACFWFSGADIEFMLELEKIVGTSYSCTFFGIRRLETWELSILYLCLPGECHSNLKKTVPFHRYILDLGWLAGPWPMSIQYLHKLIIGHVDITLEKNKNTFMSPSVSSQSLQSGIISCFITH